jgi:hypothetical protein
LKIKPEGFLKPSEKGTTQLHEAIRNEVGQTDIGYVVGNGVAILFDPNLPSDKIIAASKALIKTLSLRCYE